MFDGGVSCDRMCMHPSPAQGRVTVLRTATEKKGRKTLIVAQKG